MFRPSGNSIGSVSLEAGEVVLGRRVRDLSESSAGVSCLSGGSFAGSGFSDVDDSQRLPEPAIGGREQV